MKKVIAIICVLFILLTGCQAVNIQMNFNTMHNTTSEENYNNAYCYGKMTADENYVCFSDKNYGLVIFNIFQKNYEIIETPTEKQLLAEYVNTYDNLQIYNGELYYRKIQDFGGDYGIYKYNIKNKEKTLITKNINTMGFGTFNVYDNKIIAVGNERDLVMVDNENLNVLFDNDIINFAICDGFIYFGSGNKLLKYDIENKKLIDLKFKIPNECSFFVYNKKVYIAYDRYTSVSILFAIAEGDNVKVVDSGLTFLNKTGMVFYNNYIICNSGIYTLEGEFITSIAETKQETIDGKVYYICEEVVHPLIVGGNLYVFSEDRKNLPYFYVGNDWYEIELSDLLK